MEKAAFADQEAAQEFHEILQKIIEENGYLPEQMVNSTVLPQSTYITQEEKTSG